MRPILIYSGTKEGCALAECLSKAQIPCIVCVAEEYGECEMPPQEGVQIREGSKDVEEMRMLAQTENVRAVVDATHPDAAAAAQRIRESVKSVHSVGGQAAELAHRMGREIGETANQVPYMRLLRGKEDLSGWREEEGIHWMTDQRECASILAKTAGNILLTAECKEIVNYYSAPEFNDRLFVLVAPSVEALQICEQCGIMEKQIIAMWGQLSVEMMEALIHQYAIRHLVVGDRGGCAERLQAAQKTGVEAYVVEDSGQADGFSFEEILRRLEELTARRIAG